MTFRPRGPTGRFVGRQALLWTTTFIDALVASPAPIDLSDPCAHSTEETARSFRLRRLRSPENPLVLVGVAAVLFLAFPAALGIGGWLRGWSLVIVLAIGGGALLSCVGLVRPGPVAGRAPAPASVRESPAFESAFVCSKCSEYTPAPDWEALLEEFEPAAGPEEGRAAERSHAPVGVSVDDRWPLPLPGEVGRLPVASLDSVPETTYVPPSADPAAPFDAGSVYASLEHWILSESNGLVARSRTSEAPPCASCRQAVPEPAEAFRCPDCYRPICDPCRERAVEHDGEAWCAPCAINRLSAEFLGVLEGAPDPAAPSEEAPGPGA